MKEKGLFVILVAAIATWIGYIFYLSHDQANDVNEVHFFNGSVEYHHTAEPVGQFLKLDNRSIPYDSVVKIIPLDCKPLKLKDSWR